MAIFHLFPSSARKSKSPTVKHAANHQRTKRRNKDAVRNSPVLFAGIVRCKETVVYAVPNLIQTGRNHFTESLLIADFVHQLV